MKLDWLHSIWFGNWAMLEDSYTLRPAQTMGMVASMPFHLPHKLLTVYQVTAIAPFERAFPNSCAKRSNLFNKGFRPI